MKTSNLKWLKEMNQISGMILSSKDIKDTTDKILDNINDHLNSLFTIYLQYDQEIKALFLNSFSQKGYVKIKEKLKFKFNPYKITYPIDTRGPLITECIIQNKTLYSQSLKDFFYPAFRWKKILASIQWILNVYCCLAIPIIGNNSQIIGVLFMASQKKFTPFELELINFYANLFKIAFENHQKLNELQEQYELERETSSMLAHELKTPLAIALNNIQMTTELLGSNQQTQLEAGMVAKAQNAVQKINQICNSVLAFREVETQKLSMVHEFRAYDQLLPILQKYERECQRKGLDFRYKFMVKEEKLVCGGVQFEQIVTILLDNAVKYTEKGLIQVEIKSDKNQLTCIVIDTGIGIPEGKHEAIFQRFYRGRTENNGGLYKTSGIGLGLYIAKRLVQFLNGSITVEDNPNHQGSRFIASIPLKKKEKKNHPK